MADNLINQLSSESLKRLFTEQLISWEVARNNYKSLEKVSVKELYVDGFLYRVQFNPARIVSSSAKVDNASIQARRCFLCGENRPQVQKGLTYTHSSRPSEEFNVLINPFPIFPRHLTIPSAEHRDQLIGGNVELMCALARELQEYTLFYNGPKCGASAPDHFHFQAGNKGFLPLELWFGKVKRELVSQNGNSTIWRVLEGVYGTIQVESDSPDYIKSVIDGLISLSDLSDGDTEPMLNLLCWYGNERWTLHIFIRKKHRPDCYFAQGDENILISPAAVDLGGTFITPLEKDFIKISESDIRKILQQVCISREELSDIANKLKSIM